MLSCLCVHVAIVFWKCYVLRPRRNFRMARRGKTEGNGKNDYALPRARLLLLLDCMFLYRKRCVAHSERGGKGMNIRNL